MFRYLILIAFFGLHFLAAANTNYNGTWQGVMVRKGYSMDKGTVFYLDLTISDKDISGKSREELFDTEYFSMKKIDGHTEDGGIYINQLVEIKSNKTSRQKWCRVNAHLTYDPSTGYLKGEYISTDCRRVAGELILYRADFEMTENDEMEVSHIWFNQFLKDYRNGLSAPEVRKLERDNFVFEPIFFDFDKWDIRPEHQDFLDRMINVVRGHSDLRVSVTGHTDSDGSHAYNDTLSMRRANAITEYFTTRGISADKLKIEFKGERNPAATNNTKEGKQLNRRVDFKFI